jgi:Domain of unknown function (DUF5655)
MSDLWVCPKCGAKFVSANMSHSCGTFSFEALFAHSEPHVREIYQKFESMVLAICGDTLLTIIPQKSRVVFQFHTRFIRCMPRKSSLWIGFNFAQRIEHPRFNRIDSYYPTAHGHEILVKSLEELDADFEDWIRQAYRDETAKYPK